VVAVAAARETAAGDPDPAVTVDRISGAGRMRTVAIVYPDGPDDAASGGEVMKLSPAAARDLVDAIEAGA
jgi:hypothetical protein